MNYRVSVITSIYRSQEFLFDWFLDIKRQSIFSETEFILLDCNEDDSDFSIIEMFLPHDNIKYHKLGYCSIYEAWNKGIELSTSDLLTNWNVDDRRSYNSLQKQVEFLESNPDSDCCYGETVFVEKPNQIFEFCKFEKKMPILEGTLENQFIFNSPHCLPVWRKSIHDRFGMFDTSYFSAADYDMWFRVLKGGGKLSKMDIISGLYYNNPFGMSTGKDTVKRAFEEGIKVISKYR